MEGEVVNFVHCRQYSHNTRSSRSSKQHAVLVNGLPNTAAATATAAAIIEGEEGEDEEEEDEEEEDEEEDDDAFARRARRDDDAGVARFRPRGDEDRDEDLVAAYQARATARALGTRDDGSTRAAISPAAGAIGSADPRAPEGDSILKSSSIS